MFALSRSVRSGSALLLSLFFCIGCLAGATTRATAQAPFLDLGVYGGVPHPNAHRGQIVAAHLEQIFPPSTIPIQITLPLNGLLNYSFYYAPSSTAGANMFLPTGFYHVSYLDVFGHIISAGTVHYVPNSGFTNGVQVPHNPPNPAPWANAIPTAPLGIQGIVTVSVGPMNGRPFQGATVQLVSADSGALIESVTTNGNGFYSFYYTFGVDEGFILPGNYVVRVTLFDITQEQKVTYQPDTDPTSIGYFVLGARAVANFNFAQP